MKIDYRNASIKDLKCVATVDKNRNKVTGIEVEGEVGVEGEAGAVDDDGGVVAQQLDDPRHAAIFEGGGREDDDGLIHGRPR